jgi:hypothetical protein
MYTAAAQFALLSVLCYFLFILYKLKFTLEQDMNTQMGIEA